MIGWLICFVLPTLLVSVAVMLFDAWRRRRQDAEIMDNLFGCDQRRGGPALPTDVGPPPPPPPPMRGEVR